MKTTTNLVPKLMLILMTALFVAAATPNLWAHDGQWDSRHHYYRDNYGYWNEHDAYHHYLFWHNHHGYWDNRGAVRVFINVD